MTSSPTRVATTSYTALPTPSTEFRGLRASPAAPAGVAEVASPARMACPMLPAAAPSCTGGGTSGATDAVVESCTGV